MASSKRGPAANPSGGAYYYAGGERVALTPADDLVALDADSLDRVGGLEAAGSVRRLTDTVRLVDRAGLDDPGGPAAGELESRYPVFRAHGAVLVALPEVRVEESRKQYRERLEEWLRAHATEAVVESRSDDRLVLRPASGNGSDALDLANALNEQVGPEMAQVRFLRVTPRPGTAPRG